METTEISRRAAILRIAVLVALVVGLGAAFVLSGGRVGDALQTIRDVVDRAGPAGPVLFVLTYAVLTVLLVPGSPLTVAAGVLFGPALGTVYVVIGATIGAVGAFLWGRMLGRRAVAELAGDGLQRVDRWLGRRGLVAVLYLRFVPLVPFNLSNPVAGVTGIGLRDFALGTFLGIIPGTFAFAALGGSIDDPTSPMFLGALALLVLLAVVVPWVDRRRRTAAADEGDAADR